MNKNNFYITENTQRSYYRLWVLFFPNYVNAKLPLKKVLYGFNTKPENVQLKYLEKYVEERKLKIQQAEIYNNQTKSDLLRVWDPRYLTWREPTTIEKQKAMRK